MHVVRTSAFSGHTGISSADLVRFILSLNPCDFFFHFLEAAHHYSDDFLVFYRSVYTDLLAKHL